MRKIGFVTTAFLVLVSTAWSTPDRAVWLRTVFLGADAEHYYCIQYERDQPGSHYNYDVSVYFAVFSNGGEQEERALLRRVRHFDRAAAEGGKPDWAEEVEKSDPVNVMARLFERGAEPAFPEKPDSGLFFDEKGLSIRGNKKVALLIGVEEIEKQVALVDKYKNMGYGKGDGVAVREKYTVGGHVYFMIESGEAGCYDDSFYQVVAPVEQERYRSALKAVKEKQE